MSRWFQAERPIQSSQSPGDRELEPFLLTQENLLEFHFITYRQTDRQTCTHTYIRTTHIHTHRTPHPRASESFLSQNVDGAGTQEPS